MAEPLLVVLAKVMLMLLRSMVKPIIDGDNKGVVDRQGRWQAHRCRSVSMDGVDHRGRWRVVAKCWLGCSWSLRLMVSPLPIVMPRSMVEMLPVVLVRIS